MSVHMHRKAIFHVMHTHVCACVQTEERRKEMEEKAERERRERKELQRKIAEVLKNVCFLPCTPAAVVMAPSSVHAPPLTLVPTASGCT